SQIHRARNKCLTFGNTGVRPVSLTLYPTCAPVMGREYSLLSEWGGKWFPDPCDSKFDGICSWHVVRQRSAGQHLVPR
ncbi:hypothetical protein, partial [Staphylococcus aureus]|uniref:hypothetical protein n=1 Tax=Staphylococcus aureus TaxID=1280 RepID=UPI001E2BFF07